MIQTTMIKLEEVSFIKELYPRLREDESAIERYRTAIDMLPPIIIARRRILVDGFHRWQANRREGKDTILAIDLGNLSDVEIIKESLRRNAAHGVQLSVGDKKHNADRLYRLLDGDPNDKFKQISHLLSVTLGTAKNYCRDARRDEKQDQQQRVWDLWLDCHSQEKIAEITTIPRQTISGWLAEKRTNSNFGIPPGATKDKTWGTVQHFDVWDFHTADSDSIGKMPPQIVQNLLWLFTEPGDVLFDPFAASGTTIDVAKEMGRRVWASDRKPANPLLPIHKHDITTGWPEGAPQKVDLALLDPLYWKQSAGKYSKDPEDLGNIEDFLAAWEKVVRLCAGHLSNTGYLAFIGSPAEDKENDRVVDLAFEMYAVAKEAGLNNHRRYMVTYSTQQATRQQVDRALKTKRLLNRYRDLLIMAR